MIYCGIDFSINCTGICIVNRNKIEFISLHRKTISEKHLPILDSLKIKLIENRKNDKSDEISKLEDAIFTTNTIFDLVKHCDIIGIEGLSFGSKGNRLAEIAGYQYLLRKKIYEANIPLAVYPPGTIKKFAGKGNYDKTEMVEAFLKNENNWFANRLKKLNLPKYIKPIDDLVDAYYIAQILKNLKK